jgi:hypothetical protein
MDYDLKDQESLAPVRKVWASFISTILFAVVMMLITQFFPELVFFIDAEAINALISFLVFSVPGLVATGTAYMAREWGKEDVFSKDN